MLEFFVENKVIDNVDSVITTLTTLSKRLKRIYEIAYNEKVTLTDDENALLAEAQQAFYKWNGFIYNIDNKSIEDATDKLGKLIDKIAVRRILNANNN